MTGFPTARFLKDVAALRVGKKLPDAVYLHRSSVGALPPEMAELVEASEQAVAAKFGVVDWDVLKLSRSKPQLSLSTYPGFFTVAFPGLDTAYTVDLEAMDAKKRDYPNNKPILHRKESFLLPGHPAISKFRALTAEAENAGLFEHPNRIGLQRQWEELLASKGLTVRGHHVVRVRPASGGSGRSGYASGTRRGASGCKGLRVVPQEFDSSGTSRPIKASLFSSVQKRFGWKPGTVNLDIGGGRFELTTEYLADLGVKNLVHDLYNRSQEHNDAVCEYVTAHGLDTVTNSNVLNVIKERSARSAVISFCASMAERSRSGVCIFATYDPKDGKKADKTRDGWQERRPLESYVPEIAQHFKHYVRMGDIVVASQSLEALTAFTGGGARRKSGSKG